jgi:hypothetical protein
VALDSEYQQLPQDRPLWLFGRENRFAAQILEALGDQLEPSDPYAAIASPGQQPVGLVNANPQDLPALGRKLPHYGKYGKLRFASESMENTLKERGPRGESALTLNFELQEE